MRILHVTKRYPHALGGDAIVVQNLEKQQKKNKHKVFILTTNCDEIIKNDNVIKFGLKIEDPKLDKINLSRIFSLIILYFKSKKILKEIKPDVVHSHSVDMGFIMSFACRKYGVPIINHFHTGLFTIKNTDTKRGFLERFLLKHSRFNKVITVNPKDINFTNDSEITFVPNGIDLDIFKNNKIKKHHKEIKILFVGRINKLKGLTYLIEAVKELKDKKTKFELNIIGEGEDFDFYKNMTEDLELNKFVNFLGKKFDKELINFYFDSDIFILPSLDEGFPITLLEAWAFKLPVIITNVGGVSKVCTNNKDALIIPSKNSEKITEAIEKLISNKKLGEKLGEKGRRLVEERYNWEMVNKNLERIYSEVLRG